MFDRALNLPAASAAQHPREGTEVDIGPWIFQSVKSFRFRHLTDTLGATASYLEFKGDGLTTFERALDRVERILAVIGSRLLESQKRVSESAEALAIRQVGESSIIAGISVPVTASLNDGQVSVLTIYTKIYDDRS